MEATNIKLYIDTLPLALTFGHYELSLNVFVVERRKSIEILFIIFKTVHQVSVEVFMCARNETQLKINNFARNARCNGAPLFSPNFTCPVQWNRKLNMRFV
jgi:hypothetical protein